MKPIYRNVLLIVLALGLAGGLTGLYLFNKKAKDLTRVKADYSLLVSDLVDEFDSNEAEAGVRYTDKVLEVSGTLVAIEKNADGSSNLLLMESGQFSGVLCTLKNHDDPVLQNLRAGSTIRVKGICSGKLMDVLLTNGVVIN